MIPEDRTIKVRELEPGHMVDLSNQPEPYVNDDERETIWQYEYAVVATIEHETPECTVVYFENAEPIGFAPDHEVTISGETAEEAHERIQAQLRSVPTVDEYLE